MSYEPIMSNYGTMPYNQPQTQVSHGEVLVPMRPRPKPQLGPAIEPTIGPTLTQGPDLATRPISTQGPALATRPISAPSPTSTTKPEPEPEPTSPEEATWGEKLGETMDDAKENVKGFGEYLGSKIPRKDDGRIPVWIWVILGVVLLMVAGFVMNLTGQGLMAVALQRSGFKKFMKFLREHQVMAVVVGMIIATNTSSLTKSITDNLILPIFEPIVPSVSLKQAIKIGPFNIKVGALISSMIIYAVNLYLVFLMVEFISSRQDIADKLSKII